MVINVVFSLGKITHFKEYACVIASGSGTATQQIEFRNISLSLP